MTARILIALCLTGTLALALPACGDDDSNPGQDGSTQDGSTQSDGGGQQDAAVTQDLWIGASCTCTDAECEQLGVPKPNSGTIAGCDNVDQPWTGADLVCLRSYTGALATDTYFANGYCSLMATTCTGDSLICDSAVMGDYATMVACPAGSVMLQDTQDVTVMSFNATIESKNCAPSCTTTADCREGEIDPVFADEATQYQCNDKGGVKFCYDPRNLGATYTATAF